MCWQHCQQTIEVFKDIVGLRHHCYQLLRRVSSLIGVIHPIVTVQCLMAEFSTYLTWYASWLTWVWSWQQGRCTVEPLSKRIDRVVVVPWRIRIGRPWTRRPIVPWSSIECKGYSRKSGSRWSRTKVSGRIATSVLEWFLTLFLCKQGKVWIVNCWGLLLIDWCFMIDKFFSEIIKRGLFLLVNKEIVVTKLLKEGLRPLRRYEIRSSSGIAFPVAASWLNHTLADCI